MGFPLTTIEASTLQYKIRSLDAPPMILLSFIVFVSIALVGLGLVWTLWHGQAILSRSFPIVDHVSSQNSSIKATNPFVYALLLSRLSKLKAQGELASVIKLFQEEALPEPVAFDQIATYASILIIVGECYQLGSDWKRAVTCYEQALFYFGKVGHKQEDLAGRLQYCNQRI